MNDAPKKTSVRKPGRRGEPRWGVVATVREPAALVLAFAAHHLGLGAANVTLFFDDPDDPAADLLEHLPGCTIMRCDTRYWRDVCRRRRPALQSQRQMLNATWTYRQSSLDWLLHIDADEFLHLDAPLSKDLARLKSGDGWLKIRNFERIWLPGDSQSGLFDGAFRRPHSGDDAAAYKIYGAKSRFLMKGFAGHPIGKALSATGRGFRLNAHAPRFGPESHEPQPGFRTARHAALLHFDGLTPLHWAAKTLRYAEQGDAAIGALLHPQRQAQVRHVRDVCRDLRDVLEFHRALFCPTRDETRALDALGLIDRARINPALSLERLAPGLWPAIDRRGFDASLGSDNAARLMARIHRSTDKKSPLGA